MRVALIVDNPYRDLPGLVLLATRLCDYGATCYLVPLNLQHRELWTLAPDFVLLNYLRTNNQELARQLMDAGIKVGVLDTEGGVLSSLDAYAKTMARDVEVRHRIACYCSWGRRIAEHSIKNRWYLDYQVVLTGSPQSDFYTYPWREATLMASPYVDEYPKPLVLVNGNFPIANPQFKTPEQEVQSLIEYFGYDRDYACNWQRTQGETMLALATLTNHLAARFPRATFVYRPHPFENLETYSRLLEARNNLHLIRTGTVNGWILRASAVIQRSCSTAIEAAVSGIPALLPGWIPTPVNMPAAEEVSTRCENERELEQTLDSILAGNFEPPPHIQRRLEEVIGEWFYQIDGLAHKRVADSIVRGVEGNKGHPRLDTCRDFAYGLRTPGASFRYRANAILKKSLGLSVHWSPRRFRPVLPDLSFWDKSEKYFGVHEVRALVDAVQAFVPNSKKAPPRIGVQLAQEAGGYQFGYLQGRSVSVFSA